MEYFEDYEYYVATLSEYLKENSNYFLYMKFDAHLNDELRGFYRSSYKDENGEDV